MFDNVLIEPKEAPKKVGTILLPESKEEQQIGKVIQVGVEVKEIKSGNVVIYKKWKGNDLTIEGKKMIVVGSKDILAVIK